MIKHAAIRPPQGCRIAARVTVFLCPVELHRLLGPVEQHRMELHPGISASDFSLRGTGARSPSNFPAPRRDVTSGKNSVRARLNVALRAASVNESAVPDKDLT